MFLSTPYNTYSYSTVILKIHISPFWIITENMECSEQHWFILFLHSNRHLLTLEWSDSIDHCCIQWTHVYCRSAVRGISGVVPLPTCECPCRDETAIWQDMDQELKYWIRTAQMIVKSLSSIDFSMILSEKQNTCTMSFSENIFLSNS